MSHGGKREGAGRPKGSRGANVSRIIERLSELEYDPLEAMINMLDDSELSAELKFKIHEHLSNKIHPKIQPIDYYQFKVQNQLTSKDPLELICDNYSESA
jgi:hypothetical protein